MAKNDSLIRIAMWSGPRNISTALMRSFENRPDCSVSDEPFYGYYLKRTGINHPMANDIIRDMCCNYNEIARNLKADKPDLKARIWYQKHMSLHILEGDDLTWCYEMTNCFLIRHPRSMIASYVRKRENPVATDFGLDQQWRLFEDLYQRTGKSPVVIDAADILKDPETSLKRLCEAIGICFLPEMLSWPAGPRASDGIWSRVWYRNVIASTGFKPYRPTDISCWIQISSATPIDFARASIRPAIRKRVAASIFGVLFKVDFQSEYLGKRK